MNTRIHETFVSVSEDSQIYIKVARPHAAHNIIVFHMPGYRDTTDNPKSRAIMDAAVEYGAGFVTLDYRGHGQSKGPRNNEGLRAYLSDALAAYRYSVAGPEKVIVTGHSIGAHNQYYLEREIEQERPGQIIQMISIAPVLAFMDEGRLGHKILSKKKAREELDRTGQMTNIYAPELVYSRQFIDDYRQTSLVREGNLPKDTKCPVVVVNSKSDAFSPAQDIEKIVRSLPNAHWVVSPYPKDGHTMHNPEQLALITAILADTIGVHRAQPQPNGTAARSGRKTATLHTRFPNAELAT